MAPHDRAAWLRLCLTPGVGPQTALALMQSFGLPQSAFDASEAALASVVGPVAARALSVPPEGLDAAQSLLDAWLEREPALHHFITLGDPQYPQAWLELPDPPLAFYAMGHLPATWPRAIAVVGSRNATPQGLKNAQHFSAHLAQAGWCVVSGLALGIDGAAHEGALGAPADSGLPTVAVVGTGLDRVYPRQHHTLAQRIAQRGLILSEFPLGTPALPHHFPRRNRLIAGLSRGVLVVEAAVQSGSLITARMAAEYGREVFAIPGSIHSPQARGCHALIRQGAKLVETAQDILDELGEAAPTGPAHPATDARKAGPAPLAGQTDTARLRRALGHDPVSLDALLARLDWPLPRLQAALTELELDGCLARLPAGLYQALLEGDGGLD